MPLLEFYKDEVDGIPAFWCPGPEPFVGGLSFGVGASSEPLIVRGVSHLVEHLALHGFDHRRLDFNGAVSIHTTTLYASGTVDEVRDFLQRAAIAVQKLPSTRLVDERRVLRAEASGRGGSIIGTHLAMRFGPDGAALVDYPELGLHWISQSDVTEWASKNFTRDNAALYFNGPPPEGLHLDLPAGDPPARPRTPHHVIDLPAWTETPGNVVAVSAVGETSAAWRLGNAVLMHVIEERLRHKEGRTYSVVSDYIDVGGAQRLAYCGADCRPEDADHVRQVMSAELSRLRTQGPRDDEIQETLALIERAWSRPQAALASAGFAAESHVTANPVRAIKDVLNEYRALQPHAIAEALHRAEPTALWTVPNGTGMSDQRFRPVPAWSSGSVEGTGYKHGDHFPPERASERLVVGQTGVSYVVTPESHVTVRWDELAAAVRWTDRSWTLFGRDGFRFNVRARDWYRGAAAHAEITKLVPPALLVEAAEALAPNESDEDPRAELKPGRAQVSVRNTSLGGRIVTAIKNAISVVLFVVVAMFLWVAVSPSSDSEERPLDAATRITALVIAAALIFATWLLRRRRKPPSR